MIKFIKALGVIWAVIGFGNICMMPWTRSSYEFLTFGLIFNMLLFIFPGLVVYILCGAKRVRRP